MIFIYLFRSLEADLTAKFVNFY